jgi:hypothetical protein
MGFLIAYGPLNKIMIELLSVDMHDIARVKLKPCAAEIENDPISYNYLFMSVIQQSFVHLKRLSLIHDVHSLTCVYVEMQSVSFNRWLYANS